MRIDFVSDVACPWCAVGLHSLEMRPSFCSTRDRKSVV